MNFAELGRVVARTNAVRFHGHDMHSHDEPHLVYMVSGTGRLSIEGRTVLLRAHHSAWIPAREPHALALSGDGMAIGPILNDTAVPPDGRTRILGEIRALSDFVTVLLCAAPETDEEREPFRRALEDLLHSLTREHFPLRYPRHPIAYAVATDAAVFDGTLSELAERHYTSVRHLQRLFLDETGMTFARWRTRSRLNAAIANLRAGGTIRTAMHESGFQTRQGLLKAMSRECGVPLAELIAHQDGPLALLDTAA